MNTQDGNSSSSSERRPTVESITEVVKRIKISNCIVRKEQCNEPDCPMHSQGTIVVRNGRIIFVSQNNKSTVLIRSRKVFEMTFGTSLTMDLKIL